MSITEGLLFLAIFVALWVPDTPVGKILRRALIDDPARMLSNTTPLKTVVGVIVFFALIAFVIGGPEVVAIMGIGDLSLYLDITVVTLLVSAALRFKSALTQAMTHAREIAARIVVPGNRARARNLRSRPRRPKSPPSDSEDGAEWDWAFA